MKSKRKVLRLICILLTVILMSTLLSGCKSASLKANKLALTTVGTVGEYNVPYEELYFLAMSYKTDGITAEDLWANVSENIKANYAILTLCDAYSQDHTEDEIDDSVQKYIDSVIDEDFGGSRKDYITALEESYMTDHYVRFTAKVDIMYDSLATKLATDSEIETDEEKVIDYIGKNFVRTWHFMIANNNNDDPAVNLANAEAALSDLKNGSTTMYKLIGGPLNEDLLIGIDGYTFARGSMEKAYEEAAFSLEVGQFSEVISAKGELANGEYTDCYYIIERLPLDKDFIKKNYASLYEKYEESIIADKLSAIEEELEFVPNEYAASLDILDLEPIDAGTDVSAIIAVCVSVGVASGIAVAVVFSVRHFKKKKAMLIAEAKARKNK